MSIYYNDCIYMKLYKNAVFFVTNLQWQKADHRLPGDKLGVWRRSYTGAGGNSFGLMDMFMFLTELIVAQGYIHMSFLKYLIVVRTFNRRSTLLTDFQVYNTVLSIGMTLYSRSLEPIKLFFSFKIFFI